MGEEARTTKAQYPIRKTDQVLKVGVRRRDVFLPGERPIGYVPGICNYDINSLSAAVMLSLWSQRVADPIIVVVKPHAEESMVTYLRAKRVESSRKAEGKGSDMLTKCNQKHQLLQQ